MGDRISARSSRIDFDTKYETSYCIDLWLRDEQVRHNLKHVKGRIETYVGLRNEPIAVVGFGPSLKQTWEKVKEFKYVISCSGSHKFLLENGIIPTWHVEVDPRAHKVELLGTPHKDVIYLPASTCHPEYFAYLKDYNVQMWHIFANEHEAVTVLPPKEWSLFGGPDVGQRAIAIARFLGFTELHCFGMDGCAGQEVESHALTHPKAPKKFFDCEYPVGSGKIWKTTPALKECAKSMHHELDMLRDVKATFYGESLISEIMKTYERKPLAESVIAINKPFLISPEYRELNRKMHEDNLAFGVGGAKHVDTVKKLQAQLKITSVLDYGCGKGYLAKALDFPIWEYDPAVAGKDADAHPAELVVCTDVLEHIEPDKLEFVLADLQRCTLKVGFFVIHTGPSSKSLPDGRNAHLIQENAHWWQEKLGKYFHIGTMQLAGPLLFCVLSPRMRTNIVVGEKKVA